MKKLAREQHRFPEVSAFKEPVVSHGSVFTQVEVELRRDAKRWYTVEIPLQRSERDQWKRYGGALWEIKDEPLALELIPAAGLRPAGTQPADGEPVPLRTATLSELRAMPKTNHTVEIVVVEPTAEELLAISTDLYSRRALAERRFLALAGVGEPVLFDLFEGRYRQWGWYLLTPVTVAVDVAAGAVLLPITMVVLLIHGTC